MKPATLIVMSVGLIITILGFSLCFMATQKVENEFPDNDLFRFEGKNFEMTDDGDTVRTEDFSDTIEIITEDEKKTVEQDVKVLAVTLSGIDNVEIIGGQERSLVQVYNMQAGRYACRIGSGIMTVSNAFEKSLIFDYVTDILDDFDGIRKYFNPSQFEKKEQKVIIYINDNDLLNRIDLNFSNCKNVTVKNLTCSLDCKVVLDNSDILFENCKFKDPEIIWGEPEPETPSVSPSVPSKEPDVSPDTPSLTAEDDNQTTLPDGGTEGNKPTVINHYLTVNLNMKNGSNFTAKGCSFSGFTALVNKRAITESDVSSGDGTITDSQIGTYVSNKGTPCTLNLDFTMSAILYGFDIRNIPDEEQLSNTQLVTVVNGYPQSQTYLDNAGNKDYPQVSINASNCAIDIKN